LLVCEEGSTGRSFVGPREIDVENIRALANYIEMRMFLIFLSAWGVAAFARAVPLRVASFNVKDGFGLSGSASYDNAKAVIRRVNPDVIAILEARKDDEANFNQMATDLGYSHKIMSVLSNLDPYLTTGFFSRYPILWSAPVASGPGYAQEMTRNNLLIIVDVPGTDRDPVLVAAHYKCCSTSASFNEGFRRAIEIRRTLEYLQLFSGIYENMLVIGDFNLVGRDNVTYPSLPSGLSSSYRLGTDVSFPVTYRTDPDIYFSSLGMGKLDVLQVNGSSATHSGGRLDYQVVSSALRNRFYEMETYNSALDGEGVGLPKSGPIPASTASSLASDHFLLFGDFELDRPKLTVAQTPVASPYLFQGQSLASLGLSGGTTGVPGTFAWQSPTRVPAVGATSQRALFTPIDTNSWGPVTVAASVTTLAWGQGGLTHNLQWPPTMQIPVNGQGTVYAQIYIPGWTETLGKVAPNVRCWIGVHTENSDPYTWPGAAWKEASLNGSQGIGTGADEYAVSLVASDTGPGTCYYAARWQINGGAYGYGGIASAGGGGAWDGTTYAAGVLTVGSTFAGWSGGATLNSENLYKYAIGGATSLTSADGEASVVGGDNETLTLTAIVRTDDNSLTIVGEASANLMTGWGSEVVSVANTADQSGVPTGCSRKVFSVSRGADKSKFLRLRVMK